MVGFSGSRTYSSKRNKVLIGVIGAIITAVVLPLIKTYIEQHWINAPKIFIQSVKLEPKRSALPADLTVLVTLSNSGSADGSIMKEASFTLSALGIDERTGQFQSKTAKVTLVPDDEGAATKVAKGESMSIRFKVKRNPLSANDWLALSELVKKNMLLEGKIEIRLLDGKIVEGAGHSP